MPHYSSVNTGHFRVLFAIIALSVARLDAQVTGCADTKYPPELPAPSTLVDSAHAMDDLGAFAAPAKPMVFSVVFNQGDSIGHVRALDQRDAAAAVSFANYVRREQPGELWAFRVRIAGGDTPALTLERSKYCPPVRPGGEQRVATITGSIASPGSPAPSQVSTLTMSTTYETTAPIEALISVDGRVVVARLLRSTGNPRTDASTVHDVQRQTFEPAKLDGQPIEALYRSGGESPRP